MTPEKRVAGTAAATDSGRVKIGVLGPLIVDDVDPRLNPRDRVVLESLVVAGQHFLGPEQLADALWTGTPPASWTKNLQGCIVRLRKLLGTDAIETRDLGYRLAVPLTRSTCVGSSGS